MRPAGPYIITFFLSFFITFQKFIRYFFSISEKTFYICAVKQFLYIIGFLFALLLFSPNDQKSDLCPTHLQETQSVMEETEQANREQHIAILKDDLKNSNLLSPRRTLQSVSSQFHIRSQSQTEKNIQYFRLKGYDLMAKLLEEKSITHHINYSTLLCRNGYHVFALRKLLI